MYNVDSGKQDSPDHQLRKSRSRLQSELYTKQSGRAGSERRHLEHLWIRWSQRGARSEAVGVNPLTRFIRSLIWRYVHRDKSLFSLQTELGYFFRDPALLRTALTHKSKEPRVSRNYEQLEFLGDAILDEVISEMLLREFPRAREGLLTQRRSTLVQKGYLAKLGEELGLLNHIKAGPSLQTNRTDCLAAPKGSVEDSQLQRFAH